MRLRALRLDVTFINDVRAAQVQRHPAYRSRHERLFPSPQATTVARVSRAYRWSDCRAAWVSRRYLHGASLLRDRREGRTHQDWLW